MLTRPRRAAALLVAAAVAAAAALALSSCSGEKSAAETRSPDEVMALAKQKLDDTSGVSLTLSTDDLPSDVQGIKDATGVGTHDPAFDGSITVVLSGNVFNVPVIAVGGKVFVQIPLTPGWSDVDPSDYGAPDPALLMSPNKGFSSLLAATTGLEEGESVRGSADPNEILTEYTGTVPGDVVDNVIPGASGDFAATYTVTADGELREAVLTGVFYPKSDSMTYSIGFDDYGTERQITAP